MLFDAPDSIRGPLAQRVNKIFIQGENVILNGPPNIDFLKIDKSLIDDVCSDERAFAIVESIASMEKAMQICTIAEGVEEGPVANRLVEAGIDYLQGFLFDRPRQFDEAVVH